MAGPRLIKSTEGHAAEEATSSTEGSEWIGSIPTTNAEAALTFCQNLSRVLTTRANLAIANEINLLLREAPADIYRTEPNISIVVPVYNEEENLGVLYPRITSVLESIGVGYEIIFVDDGSSDNTSKLLNSFAVQDHHIVVVVLARNFGHQVAITAGLNHAQGNAVIVMDADLQDPPEMLPEFIAKWWEGYDVVYAVREQRSEGWLKRVAYATFYRLLRRVANVEIPLDSGDFCIMSRQVVNQLIRMPERNRFVRGIRSWVGFNQIGLPYKRDIRHAGRPKYTFGRLMLLALDGLISFSHTPLRIASLSGLIISMLSFLLAVFYTVKKLTTGLNPPGFATLVVAIFFLAGIQLITIGVIGEYIGRIFDEVKQRPLYVVRRVMRNKA
jgi:glycosyltransferase involved in cell wall biosynthesis